MKNDLYLRLKTYAEKFPERLEQVTEQEVTDYYEQLSKEVNIHGITDNRYSRGNYRIECI